MKIRRKKLLAVIAGIFVLFAISFLGLFLVARKATQDEWTDKVHPRTPAEIRGLVDAMTMFTSEPPNFLPLSALDDEVCAAAVVNVAPGGIFHGRIMGFYNTVPVYYNGEQSYRGTYGREFQCVEYANRFLVSQGHRNLTRTGHADSYFWEAEPKGLQPFPNGNSVRPQPNDLLVFDQGNGDGSPGHVAVIYAVTDEYACFVQQNVGNRWRDCLPLQQSSDGWEMTLPSDRIDLYPPIAGWSRIQQQ